MRTLLFASAAAFVAVAAPALAEGAKQDFTLVNQHR
jgi:hypothetical protein